MSQYESIWGDTDIDDMFEALSLEPSTESYTNTPSSGIAGYETWEPISFSEGMSPTPVMRPGMGKPQGPKVHIRTDHTGKIFRVYFCANHIFDQMYITALSRFLDNRKADETVIFMIGTRLADGQMHLVGSIVSAMSSCKAKVVTVLSGYGATTETMLWCFGHERYIREYGALSFSKPEMIKQCKEYKGYFDALFKRAVEIGVLSEETLEKIWKSNEEILITHDDFYNKTV